MAEAFIFKKKIEEKKREIISSMMAKYIIYYEEDHQSLSYKYPYYDTTALDATIIEIAFKELTYNKKMYGRVDGSNAILEGEISIDKFKEYLTVAESKVSDEIRNVVNIMQKATREDSLMSYSMFSSIFGDL